MGLLDDAIREHLELKRAHGADPNEVERQEREALGAPRHGEFATASDAPPAGGETAAVVADEAATEVAPEPDIAPEPEAPPEPEDAWLEDGRDEVPSDDALEHPAPEEAHPAPAEEPPESEDVLEETPDFLQETPEHDRLWFEQRPPRDFDWDK